MFIFMYKKEFMFARFVVVVHFRGSQEVDPISPTAHTTLTFDSTNQNIVQALFV
jgi:hypothetical protein